jgi:hypothetical protein
VIAPVRFDYRHLALWTTANERVGHFVLDEHAKTRALVFVGSPRRLRARARHMVRKIALTAISSTRLSLHNSPTTGLQAFGIQTPKHALLFILEYDGKVTEWTMRELFTKTGLTQNMLITTALHHRVNTVA